MCMYVLYVLHASGYIVLEVQVDAYSVKQLEPCDRLAVCSQVYAAAG